MNDAPKKRGPKPKHENLPKEIRENIVEENLPPHVLEAIEDAVSQKEEEDRPKKLAGKCPVTGKDVWL